MTAELVFKHYRAYKLYYSGEFDALLKYNKQVTTPPLSNQLDRQFYYRIAQKLSDNQIHALFSHGLFFNPAAHISDLATPTAQHAALVFASRPENGETMIHHDLFELHKRLAPPVDIDAWLYGEIMGSQRASVPECMQMVINGELAPDIACMVLLIPQPAKQYNWPDAFTPSGVTGLGVLPWIDRLKRLDRLISSHRPGWRIMTHELAMTFWDGMPYSTLAPQSLDRQHPVSLF